MIHVECRAQCSVHSKSNKWHLEKHSVSPVVLSLQASRLIVTFDEHVISNNFKFGVIYQKLGQVCSPPPPCSPSYLAVYLGPQAFVRESTAQGTQFPRSSGAARGPPSSLLWGGGRGCLGAPAL